MVTDMMLKEAAGEAERFLLTALPAGIEPHQFSMHFERKMGRLIRRVKHPIRYKVLRSVATVALVIMTLFGTLFAFSPNVRANVISWIKSTFQEFFHYSNSGSNEQVEYEYYLQTIPDDYRELNVIDQKDGRTYLYVNSSGNILQFTYAYGARIDSMFVRTENYTQSSGLVNGVNADIYITSQENETNVIIWQDPESDALLCINTKADRNILIELARTVSKKEK